MKILQKQVSESYIIGVLLAIAGGYLDVYTYVCRGGVFANAQTGNIVLLGINAADHNWVKLAEYIYPILAFMAGIFVAELVKKEFRNKSVIHWRQVVIALEFAVLWTIAFIPSGIHDDYINMAVSFVCSMQVESFRTFHGTSTYATTMCTGNLRSATEQLFYYNVNKDRKAIQKSLQYYGIILFFILGAVIGTVVTRIFLEKSALVVCVLLLVVFVLMFIPVHDQ
ncbi:MAG: YoaK family protein [Hominisplanchenecus sp.]